MSMSSNGTATASTETSTIKRRIWETCNYNWNISNAEWRSGEDIESFRFPAIGDGPCEWSCVLNRCGEGISLFLHLISAPKYPVYSEFTLSVQNSEHEIIKSAEFEYSYSDYVDKCGYDNFLEQTANVQNVDDGVRIVINIRYSMNELGISQTIDPDPILMDAWCSMLENPKFSDVVLVVENEEIKAHRIILSARSPVFLAMFSHDLLENASGKVEISDFKADTIRTLLCFIYTGQVKISCVIEAMALIQAAEKYDVSELKRLCANFLKRNLNVRNVVEILLLADTYNIPDLKHSTTEYIFENSKKFIRPEMFKKLCVENPGLMTELFIKLMNDIADSK